MVYELTQEQEPYKKMNKRARKGWMVDTLRKRLKVGSGEFATVALENNKPVLEPSSPSRYVVLNTTVALSPIQLELTQENLELHEAFLSDSFTMSDLHRYAHMLSNYLRITLLQQTFHKHIYLPSQTTRSSPTCAFEENSCFEIIGNEIESCALETETRFNVMPYPYDPSHDPLLPCCPPICMDADADADADADTDVNVDARVDLREIDSRQTQTRKDATTSQEAE
jgi:hypothetical protein